MIILADGQTFIATAALIPAQSLPASQLASVFFLIAGILLLRGSLSGLYRLVPGFAFSFIAGVVNAWVLLIEIRTVAASTPGRTPFFSC